MSAGQHQRGDKRDAGDGVGRRHQRRVQQGRNSADGLKADEPREQEHEELYERGGVHVGSQGLRGGAQGRIGAQQGGDDRIIETKR